MHMYIQKKKEVKKPSIKFISQDDDDGIKLKILGLNSLTITSGVAKMWMPQKNGVSSF